MGQPEWGEDGQRLYEALSLPGADSRCCRQDSEAAYAGVSVDDQCFAAASD